MYTRYAESFCLPDHTEASFFADVSQVILTRYNVSRFYRNILGVNELYLDWIN